MDKKIDLKEIRIWKVTVYNEDQTTLMYVANSKLEAIIKYYEHVKLINDPEYISIENDFVVSYIGCAYE